MKSTITVLQRKLTRNEFISLLDSKGKNLNIHNTINVENNNDVYSKELDLSVSSQKDVTVFEKIMISTTIVNNDISKSEYTITSIKDNTRIEAAKRGQLIRFNSEVNWSLAGWTFALYAEATITSTETEKFKIIKNILLKKNPIRHTILTDYTITALWEGNRGNKGNDKTIKSDNLLFAESEIKLVNDQQKVLLELAKILEVPPTSLKRMTVAAIGLDRLSYAKLYPPGEFLLTDKADGRHCVFFINNGIAYIIDDNIYTLPLSDDLKITIKGPCVYEGELTYEPPDTTTHNTPGEIPRNTTLGEIPRITNDNIANFKINLFDVLFINGNNLLNKWTEKRQTYLSDANDIVNNILPNGSRIKKFVMIPKLEFIKGSSILTKESEEKLKEVFDSVYRKIYPYKTDGVIFISSNTKYRESRIYKWKPNNSIDFLAKLCPKSLLGMTPFIKRKGYTLYWLFNGIRNDLFRKLNKKLPLNYIELFPDNTLRDPYFPITFNPEDYPLAFLYWHKNISDDNNSSSRDNDNDGSHDNTESLDGKVIELLLKDTLEMITQTTKSTSELTQQSASYPLIWNFLKVRTDRDTDLLTKQYYGNDYKTAILTWHASRNPLKYEDLYTFNASYFQEYKLNIYRAQTGYNSFVKSMLIERYTANALWWIDLASGKGQDMGRYTAAGVKYLTAIDNDADALMMLVNKRIDYKFKPREGDKLINLTTIFADINDSEYVKTYLNQIKESEPQLRDKSPTGITCNFAIHYFVKNIQSFTKLIYDLLPSKGIFMFTSLDGEKIVKLLQESGIEYEDSWIGEEPNMQGSIIPPKYQIQRLYKSDTLEKSGLQEIAVKLPFSAGELYKENLVNFSYISHIFANAGMTLIKTGSFEYKNMAKEFNLRYQPKIYNDLTELDIKWISLYSWAIYSKS